MKKRICIVGAGPGGLLLAKELSNAGMDVTVLEGMDEEKYFKKYGWSDAVKFDVLKDAGLPVPYARGGHWYGPGVKGANSGVDLYEPERISEFGIYTPDYKTKTVNDADMRYLLTDRTALQKYQTKQTLDAGVKIRYGCRVQSLLGNTKGNLQDIDIKGVVILNENGQEERIEADLVVDATGQAASLRTMLEPEAIGKPFNANKFGYVYRTIRRVKTIDINSFDNDIEHPPVRHFVRYRTTKGYLFGHVHDAQHIDVAGGSTSLEIAKEYVDEYLSKIPDVYEQTGGAVEKNIKPFPPDALVAGGFMVIGHAAAQVNPTNGCGVAQAYMGALLAAQVLRRAEKFDIETLWEYAYRWMSGIGAHYAALFYRLGNLTEEEVDFLISEDIINGEIRTNDYNGYYIPANTNDERKLEDAYPKNPELVERWLKAEAMCQRVLEHFQAYPARWNPYTFAKWRCFSPNQM